MADLSVIIVSYKGWERLTKCLEALHSFTGNRFTSEVIVVDNNSEDQTIYELEKRYPEFRFIHSTVNGGYAYACNMGAGKATGKNLLILNPDAVASEDKIEKLLDAAALYPDNYIFSCRQVNEKGKESKATGSFPDLFNLTGFQRSLSSLLNDCIKKNTGHQDQDISFPDWVSGSVMLINRGVFQKLNGFDEDFWMYFEDVDLCNRIRNIGGKAAFFWNIMIEHNHGGSTRVDLKTTSITKTEVCISKHLYINKHKTGTERFFIQSFLIVNYLVTGALMALPGVILFFVPLLFVRTVIFARLISYYVHSILRRSWISPRAIKYCAEKC